MRCWCKVGYVNDSAREKLLSGPFYKHSFEIIPIEKDCFTETVIVNYIDKQLATVPDWQIRYYSFPYSMETMYKFNGQKLFSRIGHHCYQPISKHWKGMQALKLMCAVKLIENCPHFETIFKEFSEKIFRTNFNSKI